MGQDVPRNCRTGLGMVSMRRSLVAVVAMAVIAPLGLAACGDKKSAGARPSTGTVSATVTPSSTAPATPVSLSITPAAGKKGVPVSAEIGLVLGGDGKVSSVTLKGADGKAVAGTLRDDGSSWVPSKPLKTGQ